MSAKGKESLINQIFVGAFLLMLGTVLGNAMHGKDISEIKQNSAVTRTMVEIYHPNGFASTDVIGDSDTILVSLSK